MNIFRAEHFVKSYGARHAVLNELVHDDDMLQDALSVLIPGFSIEAYAHWTLGELIAHYEANPLPVA